MQTRASSSFATTALKDTLNHAQDTLPLGFLTWISPNKNVPAPTRATVPPIMSIEAVLLDLYRRRQAAGYADFDDGVTPERLAAQATDELKDVLYRWTVDAGIWREDPEPAAIFAMLDALVRVPTEAEQQQRREAAQKASREAKRAARQEAQLRAANALRFADTSADFTEH